MRNFFSSAWLGLWLLVLAAGGCVSQSSRDSRTQPPSGTPTANESFTPKKSKASPQTAQFIDVTKESGIHFQHNNGAFGLKLMPESMGSGCAFLDFNQDGYQDIFLVNGRNWTQQEIQSYEKGKSYQEALSRGFVIPKNNPYQKSTGALYRNNKNGTFTDVTNGSGLQIEMYGMGAAVGDYDNDGRDDLFVTAVGRNYLFRNVGTQNAPRFKEVAAQAGVESSGWNTSAAWVDYNKDGRLDLFVCRYVRWSPQADAFRSMDGQSKIYSGPQLYGGDTSVLFKNTGQGKFVDVSSAAGLSITSAISFDDVPVALRQGTREDFIVPKDGRRPLLGKALGVAVFDHDRDGWPDILVANDTEFNWLFRNNRNGTFKEIGLKSGIAVSNQGRARAGMGIDTADIDGSGRQSVLIGNFDNEMLALFQDQGRGLYVDTAPETEVGRASLKSLTFGAVFCDIDNDTRPDILTANGHVEESVQSMQPDVTYAQRLLLFHNTGNGNYTEIGLHAGRAFSQLLWDEGLPRGYRSRW
jgi:hypothetical protein